MLKIIFLFAWFIQPNAIKSIPVKGISDFDGGFAGVERIDFECPPNNARKIKNSNFEYDAVEAEEECWVDFYPTYINIMDKQVINRVDVIRFFQSPPASGKCCASWNLIYRDNEEKEKNSIYEKKRISFPSHKKKIKYTWKTIKHYQSLASS